MTTVGEPLAEGQTAGPSLTATEARVLELHAAGLTDAAIACDIGRHGKCVHRLRHRLARRLARPELKRPNGRVAVPISPERKAALREMREAGMSYEQIARATGVTETAVRNAARRMGLADAVPNAWAVRPTEGERPLTPEQRALIEDPAVLAEARIFMQQLSRGRWDDELESDVGLAVIRAAKSPTAMKIDPETGDRVKIEKILYYTVRDRVLEHRRKRARRAKTVTDVIGPDPGGDTGEALFIIDCDPADDAERREEAALAATRVRQLMAGLKDRERDMIDCRFGLSDGTSRAVRAVAAKLRLAPMTVSRKLNRAMDNLRAAAGVECRAVPA